MKENSPTRAKVLALADYYTDNSAGLTWREGMAYAIHVAYKDAAERLTAQGRTDQASIALHRLGALFRDGPNTVLSSAHDKVVKHCTRP